MYFSIQEPGFWVKYNMNTAWIPNTTNHINHVSSRNTNTLPIHLSSNNHHNITTFPPSNIQFYSLLHSWKQKYGEYHITKPPPRCCRNFSHDGYFFHCLFKNKNESCADSIRTRWQYIIKVAVCYKIKNKSSQIVVVILVQKYPENMGKFIIV